MEKQLKQYLNELNENESNKVLEYINKNETVKSKLNDLFNCILYNKMIKITKLKQVFNLNDDNINQLLENKALYKNKYHYYIFSIFRLDFILKPEEWLNILGFDIDKLSFEDKLNRCINKEKRLKIQCLKRMFKIRDNNIKELVEKNIIKYEKTSKHCNIKNIEDFKTYLDNLN